MFNPFKRIVGDPSRVYKRKVANLNHKQIIKIYSQVLGNPDVKGISGFDSVVRLNSTYLELVDRSYRWRGGWSLSGGIFFCMFFSLFCYTATMLVMNGGGDFSIWFAVILTWGITLPLCLGLYRMMASEVFFSTYYPIRFNRKNGMVYVYQSGEEVLAVPWRDIRFTLYGGRVFSSTEWCIFGCLVAEDGNTVTRTIPLPVSLNLGPESLDIFWEFIRCYMEEDDEYLPDLVDTIPWCPPVEKQKEGWLFGLLYLYKQYVWQGLIFNLPLLPLIILISIMRWAVMKTSKIPVWPTEVAAACQPDENDPVNKGAEHNLSQIWCSMLALQSKERFAQSFARERSAMDRIITRLKAKYGESERAG